MRRDTFFVLIGLLAMVAGLVGLNQVTPRAAATNEAGPAAQAEPAHQNNTVWTVSDQTFQSNYPNGFEFGVKAASGGGDIVSAEVEWRYRANVREGKPQQVMREDGEIDPATGLIRAVWTPRGSTMIPPWVAVYYTWALRDAAGNLFETEEAMVEYEDNSREWVRIESDEILVFSSGLPPEMGTLVIEAMASQRAKYQAGWGQLLPYQPRAILFNDEDAWLEWQTGHQDTTGTGVISVGMTSDDWGGTVQWIFWDSPETLAFGTVLHEVEHLYQNEFVWPGRKLNIHIPGWFMEGNASSFEEGDNSYKFDYVAELIRAGTLPVLLQGEGPSITGENALDGYYIGFTFFTWIEEKWGMEMHRTIMTLLGQDMPFTDSLEQATGMTVLELESEWRAWLGAPTNVPTLVPTWTPPAFMTFVTPTPAD